MAGLNGRTVFKDKVLRYLAKNPNVVVWRDDICKDLGLQPTQVNNVISQAVRDGTHNITVVEPGRAWRVSLNKKTDKSMFEELARLEDGRILAKDENDAVYWVTRVQ